MEMCIQEEWSAVNDENWDRNDSQVVCRQLGYNIPCGYPKTWKYFTYATHICIYLEQVIYS